MVVVNPMAIGHVVGSSGRYVRRPVRGHGVVRAVWLREAGALCGSPIQVVARTFPSVVRHLAGGEDGGADVEVRRAGRCAPGTLTRRAVGFDAHPWVTPDQLAALESAVSGVSAHEHLDALVSSVLSGCDAPVRDDVVVELATALERTPRRETMHGVADRAAIARRTLRRSFATAVGMSADRYRVVARAARARHELVRTSTPLAVLAWELGYADQSHLHRDVAELSGSTPTAWRERRRAWSVT